MSAAPAAAGSRLSRRHLLFALPGLVFLGLVVLFAVRLGSGDPARLPSTLVGRPVPATDLPPLAGLQGPDGRSVPGLDARRLSSGGVTILNVWASWCAPCRVEHPQLLALARDPALTLVGLNYKDRDETARRFLGTLGNPFAAVGTDATGRAAIEWGVYGVPETFVIGRDGTIRYKHVGPLTPDDMPRFMDEIRRAAARP